MAAQPLRDTEGGLPLSRIGLKPLIGYIRVSKAREEMITLEVQKKRITAWAKGNGFYIIDWLEDKMSGRDYMKRKIDNAIDRVGNGEAIGVVVYRLDRWGRNNLQSQANEHRTVTAGGRVFSATESNDTETPDGIYSRQNSYALAERQSNIIRENWRDTHQERLDNGLPTDGFPRLGYVYSREWVDEAGEKYTAYKVDPVAGPLVRECYLRYIEGWSFDKLRALLNKAGCLNGKGNPWTYSALLGTMDAGFAAGHIVHMTEEIRRKRIPLDKREYRPGVHEAIIDSATWAAYVAQRLEAGGRAPRLRKADYRLSGLLTCARCGGPVLHGRDDRYRGGACLVCKYGTTRPRRCERPRRLHLADVEAEVKAWLAGQMVDAEALVERYRASQEARSARLGAEVEALRNELAETKRIYDKLVDSYLREVTTEEVYLERKRPLETAMAKLKAQVAEAERLETLSAIAAAANVSSAHDGWETLPMSVQNEGLRKLIGDVLVDGARVIVVGRWELRP